MSVLMDPLLDTIWQAKAESDARLRLAEITILTLRRALIDLDPTNHPESPYDGRAWRIVEAEYANRGGAPPIENRSGR